MSRAKRNTLLLIGLITTLSCTTKEFTDKPKGPYIVPVQHSAPSWVHDKNHKHANYSEEAYEHAYASLQSPRSNAEAGSLAISVAKKKLIDKIQSSIRDSADALERLLGAEEIPLRFDLAEFDEDDQRALYLGEFRTDTYRDEFGTFHALVLIHRSTLTRQWLSEASSALTLWEQNQSAAPRFLTAKSPSRALECHLASASALGNVIRRVARAYGVSRTSGIKDLSRWAGEIDLKQKRLETWESIDQFLTQIKISEVSGNGQKGSLNGALGEPLVARVHWDGDQVSVPVRNFPMVIRPDHPGSVQIGSSFRTDDEGRIHAILSDLKLSDSLTRSISLEIDVSASFTKDLKAPTYQFSYLLETPDQLAIELRLVVNSDVQFSPTQTMETELQAAFLELGFARVQVRWSIEGPIEEISNNLPPTSGVSVLGHFRVLAIPGFESPHFEALSCFYFQSDSGARSPTVFVDPVMPPWGLSESSPTEAARNALENLLTTGRVARNLASEFRRWTME